MLPVDLCLPEGQYLMAITKPTQPKTLMSHFYRGKTMWKKPAFIDLRLGLEVTLYISNR